MLPLLKKNREPSGASDVRPWHPDFRNVAQLPDAKVIRTTFFINVIGGISVAILLMMVVYQELNLTGLREQIRQLDDAISRNKKPSQDAVALFSQYQSEEKKIAEFEAFAKGGKLVMSDFLYKLGKSIPAKISISSVEYSEVGINLRGFVIGTSEQATSMVSSYEKQLQADDVLGKVFDNVSLTNLSRVSESSDKLAFEMTLRSTQSKGQLKKP